MVKEVKLEGALIIHLIELLPQALRLRMEVRGHSVTFA